MSIDYSDMAFPKPRKKKKKRVHKNSILHTRKGICFLCAAEGDQSLKTTQEHHVMYGSGERTISEAKGLKVDLCLKHHGTGREGVHGSRAARENLCRIFQGKYEEAHSREEWMSKFKNYLD